MSRFRLGSASTRRDSPTLFGPNRQMYQPGVTSHPVGLVLSLGLAVVILIAVPAARPFLLAALLLGGLIGLVLYLKHR